MSTDRPRADPLPGLAVQVFPAETIWVSSGANEGDALGPAETCEPGDVYQLERGAEPLRLLLAAPQWGTAHWRVGEGSRVGRAGDALLAVGLLTLMAPDADKVELLVIRLEPTGAHYALPLSAMAPRVDYTLLQVTGDPGRVRLADWLCVAFARGTRITLSDGAQVPVEALEPGARILTRDHGAQPLRWVGRATLRAAGAFAPVVISRGTLGNAGDLVVSQHHRIFLYQRGPERIGGRAELLVQARHLVDGARVHLRSGGFTDWFSLVFDRHEIIYAEGIPAESLLVTEATLRRLPEELAQTVRAEFPGLRHVQHFGTEAAREALDALDRSTLFRDPGRD